MHPLCVYLPASKQVSWASMGDWLTTQTPLGQHSSWVIAFKPTGYGQGGSCSRGPGAHMEKLECSSRHRRCCEFDNSTIFGA